MKKTNTIKRLAAGFACILAIFAISGCKIKTPPSTAAPITLNYYKLFDDTKSIQPIIEAFKKQYPHITINYKKFTDPTEYENLIINEIAEGGGPDIFSMPNTWIAANYKKLQPAPTDIVPTEAFTNTFLDIAGEDLVYGTGPEQSPEIYALPLTIDTLALYYNQDLFEKQIPERGKPGATWAEFSQDVIKLRRLSATEVIRAGATIGRLDNISRGIDLLYALFLQYQVDFYNKANTAASFANDGDTAKALTFLTGFANTENQFYTWNQNFLANTSDEDEIDQFISGKTAMTFGYSNLYQDLINRIKIRDRNNQSSIKAADIRISTLPQINLNENQQVAYAHYFAETVARTSQHPREAWLFLRFLVNQQNLQSFYKNGGFKPTSRRDLIETQRENAIYRPFIEQLGYAKSLPIPDAAKYKNIFTEAVSKINNGNSISESIQAAQRAINLIISSEGVKPPPAKL